jgi:hypothetical protein
MRVLEALVVVEMECKIQEVDLQVQPILGVVEEEQVLILQALIDQDFQGAPVS